MRSEQYPWNGLERETPCVAALGLFDGVHHGHREILRRTCAAAAEKRVEPIVFSFRNHPRSVLLENGIPAPRFLVTPERRVELIRELGISQVLMPEFTRDWADTPAEVFAAKFLAETLRAKQVVVGFNYCFGRRAEGKTRDLKKYGEEFGFEVEVVPACQVNGKEVSSTRIRNAIIRGDLEEARDLLGRPHELTGRVVHGDGRGRRLGFPTANLVPDLPPLLPQGVYCVCVTIEEEPRRCSGMFFLGPRRTFGEAEDQITAEVHLFDYDGELYGRHLRVEILRRLRDAMVFESPAALMEQLRQDECLCKRILERETEQISREMESERYR